MLILLENDFVQVFFGCSELGVRLFLLCSVGDYVCWYEQFSGDVLVEEMMLCDVLLMFVVCWCDVLLVVNQQGEFCGMFYFCDLFLEMFFCEMIV